MKTAVDANIFVALFSGDEKAISTAQFALEDASARGLLVISPVVYAELVAGRDPDIVERFLSEKGIEVDWDLSREVWRVAGERYGAYAQARKQRRGGPGPGRILADFLIGAHALHRAWALLTSDTGIFPTYFPEVELATSGKE